MERVYLKCIILPGGFSGERTFQIRLADGTEWEGTASARYFRKSNRKDALAPDEPAPGKSIEGVVEARIRESSDGTVTVEVPSADLAEVPRDLVAM